MNSKIFAALALFAVSVTVCAQVQLTNLDQKSFKIDVTGQPTNVVNIFLRSTQFSPSTTGWVLTNISGVYGGSTNIVTNSIWGIDGFGNITPIVTNNAVIATNIVRYGVGRMFGTESWLSKALTLTNGPNYIGAAENSQFFLIGPTTNPADCQIILSNAVATGQKLVLVNQTNAIPAEGAWTLTNNTPIPDGAGVVKLLGGYDLLSTNGYISYFEFISPDWQEVGRILASGASGLLTNVFNNIVVYSNITLKGNSTLTINNITLTTNDLWHTNLVGGAATLQPVNLGLQPLVGKGWLSGTNTPASGLLPLALPFNVLSSVRSEDIGDPAASYMYIAQARNNNNPKSFLSFVASTNALAFQLGANDGTDQSTMNFVTANGSDMQLTLQKNSTNFTLFYPTRAATLVPYLFGTDKPHTTNNMMEFLNGTSLTAQWESSGQWDFGLDTSNFTPTVFGLGKLTQFAYISNSLPDNALDTLEGIRLRTSFTATPSTPAWSAPISWIGTGWSTNNAGAEEVRFSAYAAPTSGSTHPSGMLFIQGASNELSPHTVFGLSLYSGYTGTGTNVFLDNGTFGAVPGGGGGGGTVGTVINTTSGSAAQPLVLQSTNPTNAIPGAFTFYNIKDYGAIGDGTTDDFLAVSNAYAALPAQGGVLFAPAGTYLMTNSLTFTKRVTLFGAGPGSARSFTNDPPISSSLFRFSNTNSYGFVIATNGTIFRDVALWFTNSTSTPTNGALITVLTNGVNGYLPTRFVLDNIITDGGYGAVNVEVGHNFQIRGCGFYGWSGLDALYLDNKAPNEYGDWTISDTTFQNYKYSVRSAIYIHGLGGGKIVNSKIVSLNYTPYYDGVLTNGIVICPKDSLVGLFQIANCSIENFSGYGIYASSECGGVAGQYEFTGLQFGQWGTNSVPGIYLTNGVGSPLVVSGMIYDGNQFPSSPIVLSGLADWTVSDVEWHHSTTSPVTSDTVGNLRGPTYTGTSYTGTSITLTNNNPSLNLQNNNSTTFNQFTSFLAPNTTSACYANIGTANSTGNSISYGFETHGNNNAANAFFISFYGGLIPFRVRNDGNSTFGGTVTATNGIASYGSLTRSASFSGGGTTVSTNDVIFIVVDAVTVTNQTAVGSKGRVLTYKTIAPASTATITNAAGQFIDGATSYSLTASNKYVALISDGTNWWIHGNN